MRKIITLAGAIAAVTIALAAPAHADTEDTPALKEICGMLNSRTPDQVATMLQSTCGTTLDTARLTVGTAIYAYCPPCRLPARVEGLDRPLTEKRADHDRQPGGIELPASAGVNHRRMH